MARRNKKTVSQRKATRCNILIILLCLVAMIGYFVQPLWKIDLKVQVTETMVDEALEEVQRAIEQEQNNDPNVTPTETTTVPDTQESTDYLSDLEELKLILSVLKTEVREEPLSYGFSLSFKTNDILSSLVDDDKAFLKKAYIPAIDMLLSELESLGEFFYRLADSLTMISLKTAIYETYDKAELDAAGITEEFLDEQIKTWLDVIYTEGTTVDEIADAYVTFLTNISDKCAESSNPALQELVLTDEDKAEMREDMKTNFQDIAAEDGTVNMREIVFRAMWNAFREEFPEDFPEDTSSMSDLKESLRNYLIDLLEKEIDATDATTLKEIVSNSRKGYQALSYIVLFSLFTWAYLILKILCKWGAKNNAIKLSVPIWLGWLLCILFVFLPNLSFMLITKEPFVPAEMAATYEGIVFQASSSAMISFYVAIFLALFAIFYYGRLRRKLRRIAKGKERDDDYYESYDDDDYYSDGYYSDDDYYDSSYSKGGYYRKRRR